MVTRQTNSLHPLNQLRNELDRQFSEWWGNLADFAPRVAAGRAFPAVNVWEQGDTLFAEAEVPGLKSENLEIAVVGSELTIKGDRLDGGQDGQTFHRRERGVGPFIRVVRLPVEVDAARVGASMKDGVLLITLPKHEAARPRKIQVNSD